MSGRALRRLSFSCAALLIPGALLIALSTTTEDPADLPRFPDALVRSPEHLTKDAPFDVDQLLKAPEPNAAPLYLDALFEFSSQMQACFPEEERKGRLPDVRRRETIYERIRQSLENDPENYDLNEIKVLDEAHAEGFRKLHRAQRVQQCTFVTGVGLRALVHHAAAARHVVRVIDLVTIREIQRGELDGAIDRLEVALRLSRDLRPRGHLVCQIVSTAIDSIITDSIVRRILTADGIKVEHCDRLLKAVSDHQAQRGDMFLTGLKMDYLIIRKLLHDLTHQTGDFGPNWRKKWQVGENVTRGEVLVTDFGISSENRARLMRAMDEAIDQLNPEALARSIGHMNEAYRALSQVPQLRYREQLKQAQEVEQDVFENDPLLQVFWTTWPTVVEAFARHQTRLSAARCLIAIRRWQLAENEPLPRDLGRVVRAAGLAEVPTDAYSGEPMKLAFIDGRPVVYSVGSDGQDNGGRTDWKFGDQPGDFLFQLTPPRP